MVLPKPLQDRGPKQRQAARRLLEYVDMALGDDRVTEYFTSVGTLAAAPLSQCTGPRTERIKGWACAGTPTTPRC